MRFGGLVAVDDVSFSRPAARDHGDHRPQRRRQDHGLQLHHRLLQADRRPAHPARRRRSTCSSACCGHEIGQKARVARTFQNIRLFPGMTVLENLLVAQHNKLMRASGYERVRPARPQALPRAPRRRRSTWRAVWLERIGLVADADRPAGELPYGAQRRLEIARAMCTEPRLLCLDEPAAGLNPREFGGAQRAAGLDPRPRRRRRAADRARHERGDEASPTMSSCSTMAARSPRARRTTVRNDPAVIRAYLGTDDEAIDADRHA